MKKLSEIELALKKIATVVQDRLSTKLNTLTAGTGINIALDGTISATGTTDLSNYVLKSNTAGLLKNDGSVDTATYAGGTAVTLNGTSKASSTASFYAPTDAGTSGQVLTSNGSGAPTWQAASGGGTLYGTCSSTASTTTKEVTIDGFTSLTSGASVLVRFSNTNTGAVGSLKLKVSSTDAKAIKCRNSNLASAGTLAANSTYLFVYDGTYWLLIDGLDTNTTYSNATTSAAGLMSAADKLKVNGLMTQVVNTNASISLTMATNTFYSFGTCTSLTLTLGTPTSGINNIYGFEFDSGSTATKVSLPNTITWTSTFSIQKNKHYEGTIRYDQATSKYYGVMNLW